MSEDTNQVFFWSQHLYRTKTEKPSTIKTLNPILYLILNQEETIKQEICLLTREDNPKLTGETIYKLTGETIYKLTGETINNLTGQTIYN